MMNEEAQTVDATRQWMLLGTVLLAVILAFAGYAASIWMSGPRTGRTSDWAAQRADQLVALWETDYAQQGLDTKTPIHLGFSRAFSGHFTKASGNAEINYRTGQITASVEGLDPLPEGRAYELWIVENEPGLHNTAAIDMGPHGDRILNLGTLPATGPFVATITHEKLDNFRIDSAAIMRVAANQKPEFVIGGMQSIRFQIGHDAEFHPESSAPPILLAGFAPVALAPVQSNNARKVSNLIAQGKDLFINGTFGGNGRTCASCHRLEDNLSIDSQFIATLPTTDPLFVAESGNANLPPFDSGSPLRPAFEFPFLMRNRGLILENIDGFDRDNSGNLRHPPVFRMTPALFNLSLTAPYGDSACCTDLQTFSAGAVTQHFTKSLNRVPGTDFIVPTATELQALEAFMQTNSSPTSGSFVISGRNSLLSTKKDALATDVTRPEVRGRNFFTATNSCITCHSGTVFSGGLTNLNTGVEVLGINHGQTPTVDDGAGLGDFQVPQLFGLRKTHFFHNGVAGNPFNTPISGHTLLFTNLREAVSFYRSPEFQASPEGQKLIAGTSNRRFQVLFNMTDGQIDDVTAFLEAISNP